jgi:hypothetical protein
MSRISLVGNGARRRALEASSAEGQAVSSMEEKISMTKEALVALAEALRTHNGTADGRTEFTPDHIRVLAEFCASQNREFNKRQWIDHIAAEDSQDSELISVDRDCTMMPGARLDQNPVPKVNFDESSATRGRAGDS